jgi:hypothetical protein
VGTSARQAEATTEIAYDKGGAPQPIDVLIVAEKQFAVPGGLFENGTQKSAVVRAPYLC